MEYPINTGLDEYSFIGEVAFFDEKRLEARCSFADPPFFTLVESMAQAASLHFKKTIGSGRQTFLLKVKKLSPWAEGALPGGVYLLRADLTAQSSATNLYTVLASRSPGTFGVRGEFYISSIEHEEFKAPPL